MKQGMCSKFIGKNQAMETLLICTNAVLKLFNGRYGGMKCCGGFYILSVEDLHSGW
jgi:hypothetical protein